MVMTDYHFDSDDSACGDDFKPMMMTKGDTDSNDVLQGDTGAL